MPKKSNIPTSTDEFLKFFESELNRLEAEVKRVESMQEKLAEFTKQFTNSVGTRGASHYYIESIKNELQASSQKQSLLRDISQLRKNVLDYALRLNTGEGDESFAALQRKLLEITAALRLNDASNPQVVIVKEQESDELDREIERRLQENK